MPIQSKADGNVPFIGPRSRYNIIGTSARWVFHIMEDLVAPNGAAPTTAAVSNPDEVTPVVSPGKAEYGSSSDKLLTGGLFTHLGKVGHPMLIEGAILPGDPAVSLVNSAGTLIRTLVVSGTPLSGFPIRLAPGEYIKIVGGTPGGDFGFFVRLDGVKML